jgi:type I restriction enzyme S subunit
MLRSGDLYVALKGATKDGSMVGSIARLPASIPSGRLTQDTARLDFLDKNPQIANHLYWILRTPQYREYCNGRVTGSASASFSREDFLSYAVPPITNISKSLVDVFEAIEAKIELNRRMNATLEATASAIFKGWFVDFGPTRAKTEGSAPYLAPELWALFPDRLDDKGKPEGWEASIIGREVDVVGGSTPSTKQPSYWGDEFSWATPKDLSALNTPVLLGTERHITKSGLSQISSGLLPPGTVLLSSRAPIGYLAITMVPTAVNQGFIAMICRHRLSNVFVWLWTQANIEAILRNANGSTFQEISKSNFRPIPVNVPSPPILEAFDAVTVPIFRHIVENERESHTLTQARDLLLPQLHSGELRVSDADRIAGATP